MAMRIILLFFSLILVGCSQPEMTTPIQPDTNWTKGELGNGLKFHIYPTTSEPVSLRMYVHVGSAHETAEQRGYAHFLEHMAFNGSKNFSSNDVINLFEKAGLTFGADINAYTSYYETVYKLDLPNKNQLDEGVLWLRDIADGLTLSATEIDKEKGVIQGEIRRTRPEHKSLAEKYYDHLIAGTSLENLDPVGNQSSVDEATADSIRAFYTKWYQPQFTEVAITGDVTVEQAKQLLDKHFSTWEKKASVSDNHIEVTTLAFTDYTDTVGEFEAPSLSLVMNRAPAKVETREALLASWLDEIALQIMQQRMTSVYQEAAIPLQSMAITPYYMNYQRNALFSVAFNMELRQQVQDKFVATLASLRDFGVTQEELDTSLAYYQQLVDDLDYNWSKRDAITFAEDRVWGISNQQSSQSKQDYQESLQALIALASLERVNEKVQSLLTSDYSVIFGADEAESVDQLAEQIPLLRKALKQPGTAPVALLPTAKELAEPSQTGAILSQGVDEFGDHLWTLSNGIQVRLENDPTTLETVNIVYASQGGKAALNPDLFAAAQLAIPVVVRSGVGEFTGTQFDAFLTKNNLEVYPFINFTHHGIEMGAAKDKLADALKVIYNISANINVDPRQIRVLQQETYDNQERYLATPYGQWERAINRNSYQPTSSHYFLTAPAYAAIDEAQIRQVHHELFAKDRGFQLVIVANMKPEEVTPLLKHFIASIPLEKVPAPSYQALYNQDWTPRVDLAIHNEQNGIYLLRVVNPNAQLSSAKTAFMDDMIQRLLSKRLTSYVREELGLDYAPDAYSVAADQEPSTDWFIEAQVAPDDIGEIEVAVDKVVSELVTNVSEQDFQLVAKQLSTALHPLKDEPVDRTWFYARYSIHGYGVKAIKDVDAMIDSISLADFKHRIAEAFGRDSVKTKYTLTPEPK
ncbi:peptidase M16 [Vibrio sinaloensis]|uniref:Peptidase M16 n=2 Tax=Photobacterium sp. (strain ATCC 43367) TaxID=379097 RepID=A0A0A5HXU4_PHOS4|nr:peptidase M16 [Vibrio sinaloensis]